MCIVHEYERMTDEDTVYTINLDSTQNRTIYGNIKPLVCTQLMVCTRKQQVSGCALLMETRIRSRCGASTDCVYQNPLSWIFTSLGEVFLGGQSSL